VSAAADARTTQGIRIKLASLWHGSVVIASPTGLSVVLTALT
jgi:hypothetical protein